MTRTLLIIVAAVALAAATWLPGIRSRTRVRAGQEQSSAPQYDASGALIRPKNFETWVFVGSSTGLTYEPGMSKGAGEFHDVYIRPESYREYVRTGRFPEKTMFVLALYPPENKVSPAKSGYFEGDLAGMAASVKDHQRFPDGWAYFNFGEGARTKDTAAASPTSACFSCHKQHAADDNVFVQFYPILRPVAQAHHSPSAP